MYTTEDFVKRFSTPRRVGPQEMEVTFERNLWAVRLRFLFRKRNLINVRIRFAGSGPY